MLLQFVLLQLMSEKVKFRCGVFTKEVLKKTCVNVSLTVSTAWRVLSHSHLQYQSLT